MQVTICQILGAIHTVMAAAGSAAKKYALF